MTDEAELTAMLATFGAAACWSGPMPVGLLRRLQAHQMIVSAWQSERSSEDPVEWARQHPREWAILTEAIKLAEAAKRK